MNFKISKLFLFLTAILFIAACSSGKRNLEKGNYDEAVMQAIKRLRQSPENTKARRILSQSYHFSKKSHQSRLDILATMPSSVERWEETVTHYETLNNIYNEIEFCMACKSMLPNVPYYASELEQAKQQAAGANYALAAAYMDRKNRQMYKQAYNYYKRSLVYVARYRDAELMAAQAKDLATLKVVIDHIPSHSRNLALSHEFFENQVMAYLYNFRENEFVAFYSPEESEKFQIRYPDHIVYMAFDDFSVGNMQLNDKEYIVKKDSVPFEVMVQGKPVTAYQTVTAKVHRLNKLVHSGGLLNFEIRDPNTRSVLSNQKFAGTFDWACEWGYFNGDERALTAKDRELIAKRELMPPAPQVLFAEFTKPIQQQIVAKLANFYRNY